jgi:hypothetical protein
LALEWRRNDPFHEWKYAFKLYYSYLSKNLNMNVASIKLFGVAFGDSNWQ